MEFGFGLTTYLTPVLYAGCILAIILTIFYRIEIGIYVFVFFLPLQNILDYVVDFPLGKDINDLLIFAMLIRWVIDKRRNNEVFFRRTSLDIPLLLLAIWTLLEVWRGAVYLGVPLTILPLDSRVMAWKNYLLPFIIYYIIVNNIKDFNKVKILTFIMIGSILMLDRNFYSIIRYANTSHYSTELTYVGTPSSLSGNFLGIFLASYSIFLVTLFLYDNNKWRKIAYGGIGAISYYCIMFLFSRSGYLASAVSWAFIGLAKDKRILIALVILGFFWQTFLPVSVRERIEMTKTEEGYDGTTSERLGMWQQAEAMIDQNPLFGAGFDVTRNINITDGGYTDYVWHSFHNNYLQTLAELGYIGLLLIITIFILGFRCGWQLFKIANDGFSTALGLGMCACVLATMTGNITGGYWQFYNIIGFYWVFLGLVVKSTILTKEAKIKTTDQEQIKENKNPEPQQKKFAVEYL